MSRLRRFAPTALAALFATSGVAHFVRPEIFTGLIPRVIPFSPESVVYASGAVELILAAGLFTRHRHSGLASSVFLIALLPAHVQMLLDFQREYGAYSLPTAIAWARLPLQLVFVWAALQVNRR